MVGISVVRRLIRNRRFAAFFSSAGGIAPPLTPNRYVSYSTVNSHRYFIDKALISSTTASTASGIQHWQQRFVRNLSSSASSGPSKTVLIETEDQLNTSIRKIQDESLPAIFYFTAVWCGPCKLLSPVLGQLTEKYPNVTTYKIDIDQEALQNALHKLSINSVPTLHFYNHGDKVAEIVGADLQRLKDTLEANYK